MYSHMLNQTITIKNSTGTNDYGETTVEATGESVSARVELTNKSIVRSDSSAASGTGELIPIQAEAFVDPDTNVSAGDKVEYDGQTYRVVSKQQIPDGQGIVRLTTLMLQEYR